MKCRTDLTQNLKTYFTAYNNGAIIYLYKYMQDGYIVIDTYQ